VQKIRASNRRLARYAAPNAKWVLVAHPHNGLGARSAPKDSAHQPRGSEALSRGGAPWLVWISALVFAATVTGDAQSGWNDDTHGRDAVPDYERVFAQGVVKRLDIRVTSGDWQRLVDDMTELAGPFGARGRGAGGGFNIVVDQASIAACTGLVEGSACAAGTPPQAGRCTLLPMGAALACVPQFGGGNPPGGGNNPPAGGNQGNIGRDDVEFWPRNPVYIPATIVFDDIAFRNVGLRLKGNSSLSNSWSSGIEKLPFRLNFDALEDQHPEIRDQTFFGFPNLNLTNNSQDQSFLRAKVVGDLFRDAGMPSARTAFVRVFLDRGEGSKYLGLYTLVEIPDRPMLDTQFGSASGNLYKPNGTGARWTVFLKESFPKKTNERDEDWTDVEDAIAVLNESRSNAAVWRQRLEARFSVSTFLRWLALNTIVANTDAYGTFSPHNYWVYGSPRHRDRLFWIPWDHDLSMNAAGPGGGNFGGGGPGGGGPMGPGGGPSPADGGLDLFQNNVNASWPLIRYVLDDPVYRAAYRKDIEDLLNTVFESSTLAARLQTEYARIAPYVIGPEGEQPGRTFLDSPEQFTQQVANLIAFVPARAAAVRQALAASR
jgi:spore coat protein H